ncbi:MAG: hypothetical protein L0271_19715 [Gemmatimonadetes bacterium]|nr:hypothetical protein [Gemmatimonadota bacterium]
MSALAGVPFLGALAARPLVSDVQGFTAVVNGTSNFILSALDSKASSLPDALAEAQRRGLTEPDPSRDLDGLDAADKLSLLAGLFGWGRVSPDLLDVQSIRRLTVDDLAVARSLGATIKPIVHAACLDDTLEAYIGPALVPARHPLAALQGTTSGIVLSGRFVPELFFSGPGAGPDVTAATIVDDAVEAVTSIPKLARATQRPSASRTISEPATDWFVRAQFPGVVPERATVAHVFATHGLEVRDVTDARGDTRWVRLGLATRRALSDVFARIKETHRIDAFGIRAV